MIALRAARTNYWMLQARMEQFGVGAATPCAVTSSSVKAGVSQCHGGGTTAVVVLLKSRALFADAHHVAGIIPRVTRERPDDRR
jgi:hypothetical protein